MTDTVNQINEPLDTDEASEVLLTKLFGDLKEEEDGESPSNSPETSTGESKEDDHSEKDEGSHDAEDGDEKDDEDGEEDEGDPESDEDSDDGDSDEEQETSVVTDDAKITVEVNGESKEFTVGELKRLAGQEASLTQKAQAVAEERQKYEDGLKVQRTALEAMVARAEERFKPYKDFDFVLAARKYDEATYEALRDDAKAAYSDLAFYQNELATLVQKQDTEIQEALAARAKETIKELQDPEKGIPGFNRDMYNKMRAYGMDAGIPKDDIDRMVDPAPWRIIHKAMEYDKLQQVKASATPTKPKVKKTIKNARSESGSEVARKRADRNRSRAISESTGLDSIEAAADALLAKWQK